MDKGNIKARDIVRAHKGRVVTTIGSFKRYYPVAEGKDAREVARAIRDEIAPQVDGMHLYTPDTRMKCGWIVEDAINKARKYGELW